jgi:hypothetical protein
MAHSRGIHPGTPRSSNATESADAGCFVHVEGCTSMPGMLRPTGEVLSVIELFVCLPALGGFRCSCWLVPWVGTGASVMCVQAEMKQRKDCRLNMIAATQKSAPRMELIT